MSAAELIVLSLALSVAAAGAGGAAAAMLERACGEAKLRERAWAWALYLPGLPPLAMAALLLTPAPVRTLPAASPAAGEPAMAGMTVAAPVAAPGVTIDPNLVVWSLLIGAALAFALRFASLVLRAWRLSRLLARAAPASDVVLAQVTSQARDLGVRPPRVRVGAMGADALLAGGLRPVLVLPPALAEAPDTPVARAIIAHELSHLKRGDHRAVWLEEAVLTALAANPVLPWIRLRRAAAREEACDALALTGPAAIDRRDYARGLIDALRASPSPTPMPALTFHGTQRSRAMRRLKSVLTPPAKAGQLTRLTTAVAALGMLSLATVATVAVASQRAADTSWVEQDATQTADGAEATAQAAARQAAAAARRSMTPEQRERFRDPSVADYRRICASNDPADEGFCSGVIFSQLNETGVCAPAAIDNPDQTVSGPALGALVDRAKAQFDAIPETAARTLPQLAHSALRRAYPCESAQVDTDFAAEASRVALDLPPPREGTTRLMIRLQYGDRPMVLTADDRLRVSLEGSTGEGARSSTEAAWDLKPGSVLPELVWLDVSDQFFPTGTANAAYTLTARIERGENGPNAFAAEPSTIRLAPMSQRQLARLNPELTLRPVTAP